MDRQVISMRYKEQDNIHEILKSAMYLFLMSLLFFDIAVSAQENNRDSNLIVIDDMRALDSWNNLSDGNNSSINISLVEDGLKLSYDLKKPYSWVDIYKEKDFDKIIKAADVSGIRKLIVYYKGNGSPNTLELKLEYGPEYDPNPATFGYKRSATTNTEGILDSFYLDPWQIGYWWPPGERSKNEPVDFSKVKKIRFAVVSNPKSDTLGKGYVIIKNVTAETIPIPQNPILTPEVIKALIGFAGALIGAIGGYLAGRRKCCISHN